MIPSRVELTSPASLGTRAPSIACCAAALTWLALASACSSCNRSHQVKSDPSSVPVEHQSGAPYAPPMGVVEDAPPAAPAEPLAVDPAASADTPSERVPGGDEPTGQTPTEAEAAPKPGLPGTVAPASGKSLYDMKALPPELAIRLPEPPKVDREVVVSSRAELERESARGRVRIVIAASLRGGPARILGSDVEITQREGVQVEQLVIDHGMKAARKRIAIRGGHYGEIAMMPPARYQPRFEPHLEWLAEDITIDGATIDSAQGAATQIYARRIAIVRSRLSAKAYAVYAGPGPGGAVVTEDLLVAGNRLSSKGAEATIRLVSVARSVVIDNVLRNAIKHNYRVHGASDLALCARNIFIVTGAAVGFMPQDQVGRVWLLDNTVYHQGNHLMHAEPGRVRVAYVRNNVAYTKRPCVLCVLNVPAGWEDSGNRALPYQDPPGL